MPGALAGAALPQARALPHGGGLSEARGAPVAARGRLALRPARAAASRKRPRSARGEVFAAAGVDQTDGWA